MKLPQIHLRDLFWVVLLCAFAVAWWLDRWQLANEVSRLSIREKFAPEGRITAVDQSRRQVEIQVGTDEGLKIGDILDVRRGDDWIAEVVIVE